jgi:hypothetical protein
VPNGLLFRWTDNSEKSKMNEDLFLEEIREALKNTYDEILSDIEFVLKAYQEIIDEEGNETYS